MPDTYWDEFRKAGRFSDTENVSQVPEFGEVLSTYPGYGAIKEDILKQYEQQYDVNPLELAQAATIVLFNLYDRNAEVTPENVRAEVIRIQRVRERAEQTPFLRGSVHVLWHSEEWKRDFGVMKAGEQRFGRPALVEGLRSKWKETIGNDSSLVFHTDAPYEGQYTESSLQHTYTQDSIQRAKDIWLESLKTDGNPFIGVFDGHGSPDGMFLTDGQPTKDGVEQKSTSIFISVEELAVALEARYADPVRRENASRDIFLLQMCNATTFAHNLRERLNKSNTPMPWIVSLTEMYQLGFTDGSSSEGIGTRLTRDLIIQHPGMPTLGTVVESDARSDAIGNPAVFGPEIDDAGKATSRSLRISGLAVVPETSTT